MLFLLLCAAEGGIFFALISLYRVATKPDVWAFLFSLPGAGFLAASLVVVVAIGAMIRLVYTQSPPRKAASVMIVGMNVLMMTLTIGGMEICTRLLTKQTVMGERLLNLPLFPIKWSMIVERHRKGIEEMEREPSYLVEDSVLGWTVGRSRRNRTGEELSSSEGLRSPHEGMSFANPTTRHSKTPGPSASVRIALIGDSMTFGYEVRCKDTWGHVLEGLLQPQVQILNFGVSAYGLNQVFLRYEKEVRSWKPDIVLVGISSEMIRRINSIYPFLMNPEWGTFLFNRPRLVNKNGVLSTINAPVPSAKDVASFLTIQELPHLDLDDYYRPVEWERGGMWTLLEQSYIFRFANSLRPPANRIGEDDILRGAMESSRQVLTSLLDEITRDGAIPIVVYFPYAVELAAGNPDATDLPLSLKTLRTAGIEYHDVSGCLQKVRTARAYMGGGHYSPEGHLGIAQCLEPVVREVMQRSKEKNPVPERT